MATVEAPIHDNVKQAILAASELDTRLVMRPLRNTERVLNNPATERVLEIEREKLEQDLVSARRDVELLNIRAPADGLVVYEQRQRSSAKEKRRQQRDRSASSGISAKR